MPRSKKGNPCHLCGNLFDPAGMKSVTKFGKVLQYCAICYPKRYLSRAIQQLNHIAERGRRIANAQKLLKVEMLFREIIELTEGED